MLVPVLQVPVRTLAPQVYHSRDLPSFVSKKQQQGGGKLEDMFEVSSRPPTVITLRHIPGRQ